jgi:Tol biopolymer transport system component
MSLSSGARLGPYEIVAPLGAGGMGEVYKARDTRLDRTVAIKILPSALAADEQFRERFDREARVISQLDHPHICSLYDVGQEQGTAYLVMQYLDGETLADRLEKGALPLDQAIGHAIHIADALATAHRAGIVHRDLKPGNIMLIRAGAMLLDFGLAKPAALPGVRVEGGSALTTPAHLTVQGTLLGTFQYMAPEQIEGSEADSRSDIWAFGCVLYEMLSGARPFGGKSPASLLANILNADPPPIRARQPHVPSPIDHIVRRCLAKDPEARWQSMSDVGQELRWATTADEATPAAVRPFWQRPLVAAGVVVLTVAAVAAITVPGMMRAVAVPNTAVPAALTFLPPQDLSLTPFGSQGTPHFAVSPDGDHIAFVASRAGRQPSLWVRPLASRVAREIPESEDASGPFWPPDGQSVGFFAEGTLKTIGLQGERPRTLARIIDHAGAAWHGDTILVGRGSGSVLRVPAAGGKPVEATVLRPGTGGHRWPQFLPDGHRFIYTESQGSVMIARLDSTASTELMATRSTAVYDPAGALLFVQSDRLMSQPLDPGSSTPAGSAREALDHIRYVAGSGYPPVSVAGNGLLAYWDGTTVATELGWFDRQGNPLPALRVPPHESGPATMQPVISPDGRQVAFSRSSASSGAAVWLMNVASGDVSRFTLTPAGATKPVWAADGGHIFFTSVAGERLVLFRRPVSGAAKEELLGTVPFEAAGISSGNFFATDWSRDGRTAILSLTQPKTGRDILAFSVATGLLAPLVENETTEVQARLSPDNRWMAYTSNETGRLEVFVEPFPTSGPRWQVSADGGSQPVWRRDGSELFFLSPDRRLMAVTVTTSGDAFVKGPPQALFETRMRPTYAPYPVNYDVTADGQRFLIGSVRPDTGPTISILVNWPALRNGQR